MMTCESHAPLELVSSARIRHGSLASRAVLNIAVGSLLFAGLLGAGCSRDPASGATASVAQPVAPLSPQARVEELIAIEMPHDQSVTSDISDARFIRAQELRAELSAGGRAVGLAALESLRTLRERQEMNDAERVLAVERALLTVAARAAPEDTRPLLHSLTTEYGAALDLRTEAVMLYAETSPGAALEVLEPIVVKTRSDSTGPPAEFILRSYVTACEKTGHSPVRTLATVATNLFQEPAARVRAVKELGRHKELLATQALQTVLVESTGDAYMRRMAAQGLRDSLPNETACALFAQVADKEADLNFLRFLADLLEKNCAPILPPVSVGATDGATLVPPQKQR